jgi:hypothetical protein
MSEDGAMRRAKAARLARKFPAVLVAIGRGELHLTGLLQLGPHLTEANLREVLQLAKHRTKTEIAKLVRRLDPMPDVPPRIEPLGPPRTGMPRFSSSWSAHVAAMAGPVRHLAPGDRPSDWVSDPLVTPGVLQANATETETDANETDVNETEANETELDADESDAKSWGRVDAERWNSRLDRPERYKIQFTATQGYVDLLEEARDLLAHAAPKASLDEVHLRALECLVKQLRKKKYARPTSRASRSQSKNASAAGTIATFRRQSGAASPNATAVDAPT